MDNFFGRLLTLDDLANQNQLDLFQQLPSMSLINKSTIRCLRCGSYHQKKLVKLAISAYYCPTCIIMGRVRSDQALYYLPQQDFEACQALKWSGQLTDLQISVSQRLILAVQQKQHLLVKAVTGAGKTEMTYSLIDHLLQLGQAICLATPRVDVALELHLRFQRDFALDIPLLHGEGAPYFRSPLVIATTHQLLRFKAAFDLIIIDEVDAFPYTDNPMLYYAVNQAAKPEASQIFLTATSTDLLDKQVKQGQLHQVTLARRFHGHPLVLPKCLWHKQFRHELVRQLATPYPLLIFYPDIQGGIAFSKQLQAQYPHIPIAFVSANTSDRLDLVADFRSGKYRILITTTILERGVTFPKVDVFVMKSQHRVYSKSALIQIAGRAGRSIERPTGTVYFFHEGKSAAMIKAIQEIHQLNKMAGF